MSKNHFIYSDALWLYAYISELNMFLALVKSRLFNFSPYKNLGSFLILLLFTKKHSLF